MSRQRSASSAAADELALKRLHLDNDPLTPSTNSQTLGEPLATSYSPTPLVDPLLLHRWKLSGRASINNAADTHYFSKHKALVFHFLDVSNVLKDDLGQLKSCTLKCGTCGRGTWRWVKAGKLKGSTTNMNTHMREKHSAIWEAALRADRVAWGLPLIGDTNEGNPATQPLVPAPVSSVTCWN